jgi:hypothetical protein
MLSYDNSVVFLITENIVASGVNSLTLTPNFSNKKKIFPFLFERLIVV